MHLWKIPPPVHSISEPKWDRFRCFWTWHPCDAKVWNGDIAVLPYDHYFNISCDSTITSRSGALKNLYFCISPKNFSFGLNHLLVLTNSIMQDAYLSSTKYTKYHAEYVTYLPMLTSRVWICNKRISSHWISAPYNLGTKKSKIYSKLLIFFCFLQNRFSTTYKHLKNWQLLTTYSTVGHLDGAEYSQVTRSLSKLRREEEGWQQQNRLKTSH